MKNEEEKTRERGYVGEKLGVKKPGEKLEFKNVYIWNEGERERKKYEVPSISF